MRTFTIQVDEDGKVTSTETTSEGTQTMDHDNWDDLHDEILGFMGEDLDL